MSLQKQQKNAAVQHFLAVAPHPVIIQLHFPEIYFLNLFLVSSLKSYDVSDNCNRNTHFGILNRASGVDAYDDGGEQFLKRVEPNLMPACVFVCPKYEVVNCS